LLIGCVQGLRNKQGSGYNIYYISIISRQTDDKGGAHPDLRLKGNGSLVFTGDHVMDNGQTLAGSFTHFFCGEEGVKDPLLDLFGDAGAGVADA